MANSNTYIRDGFVSAGSAQITGSLGVTGGITGSLKGTATTASYVLQAVSASYAPSAGGAAFPYTGSAIITGSLDVIGSTSVTGSIRISSVTSSISALTLINSSSVANPSTAPLLMFSSSVNNNYLIHHNEGAFYVYTRLSGFTDRSLMQIGGLQLHNAASTPSVTSGGAMNITAATLMNIASTTGIRLYNSTAGQLYVGGTTTPTAKIHIVGGTAAASTAPLKFTSGTNLTTPEDGAIEFDGSNLFFTTGSTRQTVVTAASALTSSRIPFATTNGRLTDSSVLTFAGTTLTFAAGTDASTTLFQINGFNGNGRGLFKLFAPAAGVGMGYFSSNDIPIYFGSDSTGWATMKLGKLYLGGSVLPTAYLHIASGSATAGTAPIKLIAGTNLTTPEAGTIEFNGNSLFFTTGSTRSTILTNTNPASITGNVSVTGNLSSTAKYILGSDLSLTPIAGNQSVLTSWWGLQIVGNKQSTVDYTPSAIGNNSDFSVIIPNQQAAKIGLIVKGQTSQTGNLLELRNVSNTGLSAFDSTGQLALGKTTPTAVLDVNGNARITGSLLVNGSSLVAGYNPTPLAGTIQDGVTSILGNLNDWNSNFYQGTVLYSETAASTITFGQLCYRTQNETWDLADATAANSAAAFNMLGICVKSSTATNPTSILINGFVETATYAAILKTGEPLYMATTPGSMTKTAPTTSGNAVRLIGHTFWDSNTNSKIIIRFNPENSWIEL